MFIYILKLENNKYYIGKTSNPTFRLDQHFNLNGSLWTKKYKPIELIEIISNCDNYDEDKYTIKYMEKYGINNVRGGSFCELKLNKDNLNTIKKMIVSSTDKCYICGENGHYANNCNYEDEYEEEIKEKYENKLIYNNLCFRCHRKGHYANNCYAKTTVYGEEIDDSSDEEFDDNSDEKVYLCQFCNREFETYKGAIFHENVYCKKKYK